MEKKLNHKCQCCGKIHDEIPANARFDKEIGYFWECDCKSSMYEPTEEIKAQLKDFRAQKGAA